MICSVCGEGMEGLGSSVFFGLEVVFCACRVLACQDMERGEGRGSFGGVAAWWTSQNWCIFWGARGVCACKSLCSGESVRNMQGKSSWWPHILGEGPWLVTAAEPGEDYSNCRSVTGFFPSEIPFCCLGPHPLFIQTTQAMPQGLTKSVPGSCTPADAWGSPLAAAWVGGRGVEEVCDTCQVAQLQDRERQRARDAAGGVGRLLFPIL